jgi:MscS family membrane protein
VRFLLFAAAIHWLLFRLGLPLLARQFWLSTENVVIIAGSAWLFILVNGRVSEYLTRHIPGRNRPGATMMLRFGRRGVDVLVVVVALITTLYHLGVNPTAAIAGLGVGGIAVALAAQKTLENVIGGVSLIFDRAIRVGEMVKVGDTQCR